MVTNCQVCGNPMFGYKDMGMNRDGSINKDFCEGCYKFGTFTSSAQNDNFDTSTSFVPMMAYGSYLNNTGMVSNISTGFTPSGIIPYDLDDEPIIGI